MNGSRFHVVVLGILSLLFQSACAQEPVDLEQMAKDAEPVAQSEYYTYYSRLPLNLHDRLMQVSEGYGGQGDTCLDTRSQAEQTAWNEAVAYYEARLARQRSFTKIKLGIRFYLIGMGDLDDELRSAVPDTLIQVLQAALPVYQACWWPEQDRINRAWIAELLPKAEAYEGEIRKRIEVFHQTEWPDARIPVDAVNFVSRQGANTTTGGDHIQVGVSNAGYQDYAALEMLFHEASHTIVGPRSGPSIEAINAAAESINIRMPRIFWHVVLFYTSGEATRQVLAEADVPYEQYMFTHGPMSHGTWAEWRPALEAEWQPYLEGDVDLQTAAHKLVDAVWAVEQAK